MSTTPFDALCGPAFQPFSRKVDCQKSINLVRERVASGEGQAGYAMYKAPGLSPLVQPGTGVNRGQCELNGVDFTVIDGTLYQVSSVLGVTNLGAVANDLANSPVQMAVSLNTLMICSAEHLYRANGGTLTEIVLTFTPIGVVFIDNYFVALSDALNQFYFSTDDGITFPAGNVQDVESSPDQVLAMIVDDNFLYFYSRRQAQPFAVGTNAAAPFVSQQNSIIQTGIVAPASLCQIGKYRFWLDRNKDGQGVVMRGQGSDFEPISNPAVANAIRGYAKTAGISDAIGQGYELNGQQFYRLTFPAADATWEYNITIGGNVEWTQPLWWDWINGAYHRHRGSSIVAAFGKIVVGDRSNGWLYELSPDNYTDYGFPLRFERVCPHILQDNKNVAYDRLELGIETGQGLADPLWLSNYSQDAATFATNLAAAVVATAVTAAQALALQDIYDNKPYTPLDPYPTPDTMNGLGFTPWGAVAVLAAGTVLGAPPQIAMDYSDDGAKSYHQSLERSLGAYGGEENVFWDRLGVARDRAFRLTGDFPGKLAITTAWFDAEELAS